MISSFPGLGIPFIVGAALVGLALGVPLTMAAQRLIRGEVVVGGRTQLAASIACSALFALVAASFGSWIEVAAYLVLAAAAIVLVIVDLAEHRLPNVVVLPTAGLVTALLLVSAAARGSLEIGIGVLAGALGMFAIYFVLALISPRGMGMGDVKLALAVGAAAGYLGLTAWLLALVAGFLIGAVVALVGLVLRKVGMRSLVAFGPSMLAGTFLAILLS